MLKSKYVLLTVALFCVTDCALVLGELILDLHKVKGTIKGPVPRKHFGFSVLDVFADCSCSVYASVPCLIPRSESLLENNIALIAFTAEDIADERRRRGNE